MDTKLNEPKNRQQAVENLITFFREMPVENGLPPDTFESVIIELQRNPEGVVKALKKWLQALQVNQE